jgi:hypothetical protein
MRVEAIGGDPDFGNKSVGKPAHKCAREFIRIGCAVRLRRQILASKLGGPRWFSPRQSSQALEGRMIENGLAA